VLVNEQQPVKLNWETPPLLEANDEQEAG